MLKMLRLALNNLLSFVNLIKMFSVKPRLILYPKLLPTLFVVAFLAGFSMPLDPHGSIGAYAQLLGGNSHIQLTFVMVPAKKADGRVENRAITSVYTVRKAEDVQEFCQRALRVRETLIAYLNKFPVRINRDRTLQLEGIGAKIVPHINRTLGRVMVTEVVLIDGTKRITSGTASRLPFAHSQGCGRVLEEYEKRMGDLLDNKKSEEE